MIFFCLYNNKTEKNKFLLVYQRFDCLYIKKQHNIVNFRKYR